jgi:hypothetical protein
MIIEKQYRQPKPPPLYLDGDTSIVIKRAFILYSDCALMWNSVQVWLINVI